MAGSGNKKSSGGAGIKVLIIGIVLIVLVVGYYYYLSNKKGKNDEEENVKATAVQEVLLYNFERNYPQLPKEVVKLYGKITQCFYNEEYTEEELSQMAMQMQKLYDDELIANKTENQYMEDLKWDINLFKEKGTIISSYAVASGTDVDYFSRDGFDFARLHCRFTLRTGTQLSYTDEIFLLRKDSGGHWKIYGWTLADDNNAE